MSAISAFRSLTRIALKNGSVTTGDREVAEEVPVAFSYGGSTHAVMMASPIDLEDFAYGFSLTEGIISDPEQIEAVDVIRTEQGYDVQVTLLDQQADALRLRRRHMAGPVGCGLCGIESIEQAVRPVPDVSKATLALETAELVLAMEALHEAQLVFRQTRAVHGAGFYVPQRGLIAAREDVGRHNALDKLAGGVLRGGFEGASGVVVVTSRISVEMVQKAALLGSPILAAVSAPTALAIETAHKAGMTLVALVRGDDMEIFTRPDRIVFSGASAESQM
ncbi:formate dehydrogenase accessory sulfurtransferase FdhD [Rhizobium sp. Leaf262]|uniref:formate dehydrogenase accessory sulfurtransferase FdhD n=1 Tax=Rhizobium sp. Leaf262 TaxID=1736312 RepID=UPI0007126B54|nr:formate dehydrogenase accessory sulfurtransferase FdhD [Rhizobium sp. Leaf262]KQO73724.1 formate dehydrogenase family accessory protein FdhD [Rhizobium sp. Leaf262]